MVLLTVLLLSLSTVLLVAAFLDFVSAPLAQRRAVASVVGNREGGARQRADLVQERFARTRLGRLLERELVMAGSPRSPLTVLLAGIAAGLAAGALLWTLLAPLLSVLGLVATVIGIRAYLRRAQDRRREAFIAQMPELARVLANATNAGLSISTAIGIAGDEMDEPARTELRRVASSQAFGSDLESALLELQERVPSREVAVLLSTLLVSARSGGSLVTSLRSIADTLEQRKETRREIRTTLAQSVTTGYTVIALGFVILVLLNFINPGTVDTMTRNVFGQAALVFAAVVFGIGFVAIRRMTRIDL
ncbi:type II secretion system F family protein [Aquipuribacter sp. MA13-6]|uniref:type II secretion system F family protein n=1 Tax=unclassified Aquipuribacter TaxID=2635084 RepID=UPI003EEE63B9